MLSWTVLLRAQLALQVSLQCDYTSVAIGCAYLVELAYCMGSSVVMFMPLASFNSWKAKPSWKDLARSGCFGEDAPPQSFSGLKTNIPIPLALVLLVQPKLWVRANVMANGHGNEALEATRQEP